MSPDVLENLAETLASADISAEQIRFITDGNISTAREPTQSMKEYINNDGYEAAYKLNTLTVSEDGYYVFQINIPEDFVGMNVSDIKIYALKNSDFNASFFALVNGILNYGEITNMFGVKIDTLPEKVLAVGFLQASTPFSVYLAKILIAVMAGGCESGLGISGLILAAVFFLKKR